jgi:hypothetical protein
MHQFFKNERGKNKIPDGSGIIFDLSLKGKKFKSSKVESKNRHLIN